MNRQPERLLHQMYEKELKGQATSVYNYVGLTNRADLLGNILSLSRNAMRVVLYAIGQMQMRPVAEVEKLPDQLEVTIDWKALGITDRGYKSRIIKELRSIDFMEKLSKDTFIVNLHYLNPYTKLQHEGLVNHLQILRFTQ